MLMNLSVLCKWNKSFSTELKKRLNYMGVRKEKGRLLKNMDVNQVTQKKYMLICYCSINWQNTNANTAENIKFSLTIILDI